MSSGDRKQKTRVKMNENDKWEIYIHSQDCDPSTEKMFSFKHALFIYASIWLMFLPDRYKYLTVVFFLPVIKVEQQLSGQQTDATLGAKPVFKDAVYDATINQLVMSFLTCSCLRLIFTLFLEMFRGQMRAEPCWNIFGTFSRVFPVLQISTAFQTEFHVFCV